MGMTSTWQLWDSINRLKAVQERLGYPPGRVRPHGDTGAHLEVGRKTEDGYAVQAVVVIGEYGGPLVAGIEPTAWPEEREFVEAAVAVANEGAA